MSMIKLARGERYPLPLHQSEGAAAQFLRQGGSILQIVVPEMDAKEEKALRSGLVKGGFLYGNGALLWLFQFYGDNGRPLLTLDAPFDMRLLSAEQRDLPNIKNAEQRLLIEVHIVDEKQIVRGLRALTLPPDLTLAFLLAVQEQLAESKAGSGQMTDWLRFEPHELVNKTRMWVLGK